MSKRAPYLVEVALGLFLTGLISWCYLSKYELTETVSLKTYDFLSKARKPVPASDDIRIVEIDDASLDALGRWPWPRAMQAQLIDELVASGAKVIGANILYADADQNQGLEEIGQLRDHFKELMDQQIAVMKRRHIPTGGFETFLSDLETAQSNMNGDAVLAQSLEQAGNVILPMFFQPGESLTQKVDELPNFFSKEKIVLPNAGKFFDKIPPVSAAKLPVDAFGNVALAIGHSNLTPDIDNVIRRTPVLFRYGKVAYPSFGLQVLREALHLQREDVTYKPGIGYSMDNVKIPVDDEAKTYIDYAGPAGTFQRFAALDVLSGGVPQGALSKKIVLLGLTATSAGQAFTAPGGRRITDLEIWANHLNNILKQHFIVTPSWGGKLEWGLIALAALVVILALPFLRARVAIPISALTLSLMLGACGYLFVNKGIWVSPAYGALLLLMGFAVLVAKRLIFTEKGKELVEAEGIETSKMLGLSFQGQGLLDLAFEKFRRCPVDDQLKELLYNLGLDMERKRQFAKAAAVYGHIASADAGYKDIAQKIELLKKASDGAVFGSIGKKGSDATVVVDGLGQHTTLGRYEVMKELGRGAMGIVYLGKDPKINRQVAIKTLRFEEDLDAEQTKSVKERFFREAESAGNLTHPNIIRIFDAGEDQDVAYIAMELLEGVDLKTYCDKGHLFPMKRAVEVVIQIADGLDYAHRQGVVHRDIKPGNIMLLKDETLRITDFGIARIQATSKTATGAVLGTPAYMSPEQVNGKKVDGRADIFSLGVTLFELLTGEKPFHAESIAALLYRIANVEHPDPREFNPAVPQSLVDILKRALAKDPEKRYQTAGQMAADLRDALKHIESPLAAVETTVSEPMKIEANSITNQSGALSPEKEKAPPPMDIIPTSLVGETKILETAEAPEFFSELERAFSVSASNVTPPTKVEEAQPAPAKSNGNADDTVVEKTVTESPKPKEPKIEGLDEKTLVIDPTPAANPSIPVLKNIEHGYQPPLPDKDS